MTIGTNVERRALLASAAARQMHRGGRGRPVHAVETCAIANNVGDVAATGSDFVSR